MINPRRVFYMGRHGQTFDNQKNIVSRRKTDLTEAGYLQARGLQPLVQAIFDHPEECYLVTSDMPRARKTGALGIPLDWRIKIHKDHRLAERNNGTMSGIATYSEWERVSTKIGATDLFHTAPPNKIIFQNLQGEEVLLQGAESVETHRKRVKSSLNWHLRECPDDKTLVIIAHEGVIKRAASLVGHKIDHFSNGGLYKFTPHENDGGWDISKVTQEQGKICEVPVDSTPFPMLERGSTPSARTR